jgi:hypothetical protein
MPLIYTAHCPDCGHRFGTSDVTLAVQLDDGTLVPLRHPGESSDLERAGFTMKRANDEARLVRCTHYVCRRCGGLYGRRASLAPFGCLSFILSVIAMGLLAPPVGWVLFARSHRPDGRSVPVFAALVCMAGAIVWSIRRWETRTYRRHLPGRPPLADDRCCAAATRRDLVAFSRATWWRRRFPCAQCGGHAVSVATTGIS